MKQLILLCLISCTHTPKQTTYKTCDNVIGKTFTGGDDVQLRIDSCDGILIKDNHFTMLRSRNGHSIYVTNSRNIEISNNSFDNIRTGNSEVIALNGNVSDFSIHDNVMTNMDNIAIDIIGGEGTGDGDDIPKNGEIYNNVIDYQGFQRTNYWTSPLYLDAAWYVNIFNNIVKNSSLGIEIGSEKPGFYSKNVNVYNNQLINISKVGILVGSEEKEYGGTENVKVWDNEFINVNIEYKEQENVR